MSWGCWRASKAPGIFLERSCTDIVSKFTHTSWWRVKFTCAKLFSWWLCIIIWDSVSMLSKQNLFAQYCFSTHDVTIVIWLDRPCRTWEVGWLYGSSCVCVTIIMLNTHVGYLFELESSSCSQASPHMRHPDPPQSPASSPPPLRWQRSKWSIYNSNKSTRRTGGY